MIEAFPKNVVHAEGRVVLGPHYDATLKAMGIDPNTLPTGLFYTFCGDLLGASGEHYQKGEPISFDEACRIASLNFSDDFMESLAMHQMRAMVIHTEPSQLMKARDHFHDLIADHFQKMSLTYSPWFGALFNARQIGEYLDILTAHSSCGAAMRGAVMASDGLNNEQALPLLLLSHAHTESIEGGYMVMGIARALIEGKDFPTALEQGRSDAMWGRKVVQNFQRNNGLSVQEFAPLIQAVEKVLKTKDAYSVIGDIAEEGIETRFVVPAALLLVAGAIEETGETGDELAGISLIVRESLRIGGDPDTICSIAMGLYGLGAGERTLDALRSLKIGK